MAVKTRIPSGIATTADPGRDSEPKAAWVFIIIELAYIVTFVVVAYLMRRYKFMKTDDDAVTKHHRRHYEMMKKQQDELIEKQKTSENFLVAGDNQ